MKYKAIIADVDGTLIVPNGVATTRATDRLIRAVAQAGKKGVQFTLATARSLDWIGGLKDSLQISSAVILDNGAQIYDCREKKYIYELFLESEKTEEVLKILVPFGKQITIVDKNSRYEYKNNFQRSQVIKIMVLHIDAQLAEEIFQKVSSIANVSVTKSISGDNPRVESIHITHKNATKKETLIKVADYLNISLSEFIGIGDSYNDTGFLSICGLKVAMGNAVPEVKAIADYIAPAYYEDGVADVIEKFILKV